MAQHLHHSSAKQGWFANLQASPGLIRFGMNCWLPFVGAGIHITQMSKDMRRVTVRLKLRWYNRNYVGTHFGGSLFAMTDPFFMMMVLHNLGRGYIVWDKHSHIAYRLPGRGTVSAKFLLTDEDVQHCKMMADTHGKYEHEFSVDIIDAEQRIVATVRKVIYIRKKS